MGTATPRRERRQAGAGAALARRRLFRKQVALNWDLYLLILLPVAYVFIFSYIPMYGAQIAFKQFVASKGIWASEWVGFRHFARFFRSFNFRQILWNTVFLNLYHLAAGFPIPIILALLLHYCPPLAYKKTVQMVTYAPHFISTVVMVGIIFKLFAPRIGIVNVLLVKLGLPAVNWLGSAGIFPHLYVWSGIWQGMGWGSIVYLAALSGVDPELHDSARVDGATLRQRIWHIDLASIAPTIVILLILAFGSIVSIGFEKVFLMQNNLNIETSEVISTYVYKVGIASATPNFSYASAIGLFQSVANFLLLVLVNRAARYLGTTGLW